MINLDILKAVPKVELHDHLDGGLRPLTILELASRYNIPMPADTPDDIASWFHRGADRKSLPAYLEGFAVTVSILQHREALVRVAREAIIDRAEENIIYVEIRFAPSLHTLKGLNLEEIVESVLAGLEEGSAETGIMYGLILCAMRDKSDSLEIAELAVSFRSKGVVGFDIAGDEFGHPPRRHLEALKYITSKNFNITIHAGEAFGPESIWQALQVCGSHRIGHATRLMEDMTVTPSGGIKMGTLSHFIRDRRIPLEICLSSNIHTGAAASLEQHPFIIYYRNGFRVFLCTDNRLMSNTTLTNELSIASSLFSLTLKDMEKLTLNAIKSAFIHYDERLEIIYDIIKPGYEEIRKNMV
ncbi:MAG: adenosine deaminase [Spirochaetia bacterium]|jgi:adenosine deaminase|nr:adenosine deaminase [Spirochaetia bacterium]